MNAKPFWVEHHDVSLLSRKGDDAMAMRRIRIRDRSNVPMFLDLLSINFHVVYIHGGWLCAEVGCRGHQNVAKVATARGITTMMRQQKRKVFVQLFRQNICQPKLRRCRECLDLATPLQGREPERRALGFH